MADIEQVTKDMGLRQASTNADYSVVMANDMIKGCSSLSLNELKLLRTIIMQIKPDDTELYEYCINVDDFKKLIGIEGDRIYSEAQKMCIHLLQEVVKIGDGNPRHKWKAFQWVSCCRYEEGKFYIRLNDCLKPYVVGLQSFYTQFKLEEIVRLNSTHAIRLLELLHEAMKGAEVYADKWTEVYIPMDVIRKATDTEGKYSSTNRWIAQVITAPVEELNKKSAFHITVRNYKESRKIVGFYFKIESSANYVLNHGDQEENKQLTIEEIDW